MSMRGARERTPQRRCATVLWARSSSPRWRWGCCSSVGCCSTSFCSWGGVTLAEAQGTPPAGLVAEPVVVRTEIRWLFIMAGMLGIMLAVVVLTGVFQVLHPLSHIETVDPATLHLNGEF